MKAAASAGSASHPTMYINSWINSPACGYHGSADDGPVGLGDHLHHPLVLSDDLRPADADKAVVVGLDLDPGFGGLRLGETDLGHLGVGVGDPGNSGSRPGFSSPVARWVTAVIASANPA